MTLLQPAFLLYVGAKQKALKKNLLLSTYVFRNPVWCFGGGGIVSTLCHFSTCATADDDDESTTNPDCKSLWERKVADAASRRAASFLSGTHALHFKWLRNWFGKRGLERGREGAGPVGYGGWAAIYFTCPVTCILRRPTRMAFLLGV